MRVAEEFAGEPRVIITEAYDSIPKLLEYYGESHADRYADLPFNFQLIYLNQANLAPRAIESLALAWIRPTRELGWPAEQGAMSPWICWVTGNHDNPRPANKVGAHNVPALKWLSYLLPGVPVNYYGDELPLHDSNFNAIPLRTVEEGEPTRLPFRAPMAWTREQPSAGFSTSADIWVPLNENWPTNNVESLLAVGGAPSAARNQLQLFLELEKLRRERLSLLVFGDLVFYRNQPYEADIVFAMARTHSKFGNLLLLVNFDQQQLATVRLGAAQSELSRKLRHPPGSGRIRLVNYVLAVSNQTNGDRPALREGDQVELDGLVLGPSQAMLVEF